MSAAQIPDLVVIGEQPGLYKALAAGPVTTAQLAVRTKTDERYLHDWLASQAAGGYLTCTEKNDGFSLNEAQVFTLALNGVDGRRPGRP